jgi:hypothetical protein
LLPVKADKPWDDGKVSRYREELGLTKHGALIGGSKAVMIAKLTGTEPVGVGGPGDGIRSLRHARHVVNEFLGFSSDARSNCVDGDEGIQPVVVVQQALHSERREHRRTRQRLVKAETGVRELEGQIVPGSE